MLDLKKAFDFINHKLLLTKLAHNRIRGVPLKWLSDCLSGRIQKTKINGNFSNLKPISAGCPQGSVLSGLLFNLFINDMFQLISPNIEIYLYTDDTAIPITADSEDSLQEAFNDFCDKYSKWYLDNCIVVNPTKSNFLFLNTANIIIKLNGHALENPGCVKYLDILIDNNLFWKNQITSVLTKCCQRIGIFKKIMS